MDAQQPARAMGPFRCAWGAPRWRRGDMVLGPGKRPLLSRLCCGLWALLDAVAHATQNDKAAASALVW